MTSVSKVCLTDRYADFDPGESPAWEDVRESLAYALDRPYRQASEYVFPSPYVPRPARTALRSFTPRRSMVASQDLMSRIHKDFKYSSAATDVHTPVLEAFTKRWASVRISRIMIGCLRSLGVARHYVSGYLLTRPPPGRSPNCAVRMRRTRGPLCIARVPPAIGWA